MDHGVKETGHWQRRDGRKCFDTAKICHIVGSARMKRGALLHSILVSLLKESRLGFLFNTTLPLYQNIPGCVYGNYP